MTVAAALSVLVAVAPLLTKSAAPAQQETDPQRKAFSQFSDELAACGAYCETISRCLAAPKNAHPAGDLSISRQYSAWAKKLRQLAFLFSRSAGRADDATSTFIDRVKQNVLQQIRGNCANIASIVNEHGEECRQLAEHPNERLEVLLDRNP